MIEEQELLLRDGLITYLDNKYRDSQKTYTPSTLTLEALKEVIYEFYFKPKIYWL